jgi:hypothetical protein
VATARAAPIAARGPERELFRAAAGDDRLSGAVRLDCIADEDPGEKSHSYLALSDGQTERDRLRYAVDDEAGGDRLAVGRAASRGICGGRPAAAA